MLLNGSYIRARTAEKSPKDILCDHIDRNLSRRITAAHTVAPYANRHSINFHARGEAIKSSRRRHRPENEVIELDMKLQDRTDNVKQRRHCVLVRPFLRFRYYEYR